MSDKEREINAYKCLDDMALFVRRMFYDVNKREYIMGAHHKMICSYLRRVANGECKRLIINIAPRYGKTALVSQMFIAWGFALNPASKFLHLSYSKNLVTANAQMVKQICTSPYYQYLYGDRVQIVGKSDYNWSTQMGGKMYAVSSGGQVTGFGAGEVDEVDDTEDRQIIDDVLKARARRFAGAIVIDDPLKPDDALSDSVREFINNRFDSTIRSRTNSRHTPIVVIMQRLHENDLCGYLLRTEPNTWEVLSLPCITSDGSALWSFKHTLDELEKLRSSNPYVFETQYMQNAKPIEGLMYERFRTYEVLPIDRGIRKNYTDTADTGADYLCSIDYVECKDAIYVLDVLYTQKSMEVTEIEVAKMLNKDNIEECRVESNNGGRGFMRNVEKNVRELGNNRMRFIGFTQSKNKQTRIFTNSSSVQNIVFFPADWRSRWNEFASALLAYRKEGRNAHDDAPDALTGLVEWKNRTQRTTIRRT